MTNDERKHLARVAEIGCVLCKGFAALAGMTEAQLVDKMQRDYGWSHEA